MLVAVYNAENYLCKCLDSLLGQTLHDIQVVCIDDCSTDGSLAILRDYAEKDDRVDVIHLTENHGQAHARNEGLKLAKGKYVGYLDSDDWLAPDALQQVAHVFNRYADTDCVLLRFFLCNDEGKGKTFPMPDFDVLNGGDAFVMSLDWTIHGCYVARKSLYDRWPYDESCKAYSDDNTTRLHYLSSRNVRKCDGTYYYRMNPNSVTHAITPQRFDFLRARDSMKSQLMAIGVDGEIMRKFENIRWLTLVDTYMFYHCHGKALTRADRREGLSAIKHVWLTTDRSKLDKKTTRKFGYCPMPSWPLFRLEEWLYFTIRGLLGKNK